MASRVKLHPIIIPFPCINLVLKLASKGFLVTFVHLEFVHHTLSKSRHDKQLTKSIYSPMPVNQVLTYVTQQSMMVFLWNTTDFSTWRNTLNSWPETIAEKYNLVNVSVSDRNSIGVFFDLPLGTSKTVISHAKISKHVFEAIAYGLLLSEVNFIWVVRPGIVASDDANGLPAGFEDAVQDRGLVVPWCNQVMVLSNPAAGGFFTHCGWNSELVVDDWKIGINLCDGSYIDREEVALKIKRLMSGTILKGLNQRIMEVRVKLHDGVHMDGSSERKFGR
ncbi:UDP-glycosyltransferase 86A1-like [Sesamum indicum]|uniref:UDP-glycosyltransferase 86A1-like n=1 Tax=Sesamum indicum TaxID=4182 RepID=A0A6I9UK31_SESIN|nr:UDP-glycosyltransferase 86A1-like [Sesamum indicum]